MRPAADGLAAGRRGETPIRRTHGPRVRVAGGFRTWLAPAVAPVVLGAAPHPGAQELGTVVAPTVEVTAPRIVTPLPGVVIGTEQMSTNVKSATSQDLEAARTTSLTDFMNTTMQSVNVNDYQGNPFQQDLNFRGFSASPLIGTPQGLSVYVDGVRVNEGFGDVVNWDLIPNNAIARLDLLPGSNPLFGLNTLGGALSIATKSGFTDPGIAARYLTGSWGRRQAEASVGGVRGPVGGFVALNSLDEDGWRDNSPSSVKQAFAKATVKLAPFEANASLIHADNRLVGNGMVPVELYREDPAAVFTSPDESVNRLTHVTLQAAWNMTDAASMSALAYRRELRQRSAGGDFYDEWDQAANGRTGLCPDQTTSTYPDGGAEIDATGCPGVTPNGLVNYGRSDQLGRGSALQFTGYGEQGQIVLGIAHDRSDVTFGQSQRLGWIGEGRDIHLDPGAFDATGLTATVTDIVRNNLSGSTATQSVFALGIWSPDPTADVTAGARYSRTRVKNTLVSDRPIPLYQFTDQLARRLRERCGAEAGDVRARYYCSMGDYVYESLNPLLGISLRPRETLDLFASASRGSRTPSVIELGCARDHAAEEQFQGQNSGQLPGCSIPTALTSDPYLPQVRSRSIEAGLRGTMPAAGLAWNASLFRTDLTDDILFVSLGRRNRGVFDTFGRTRRQGVELGLTGHWGRHTVRAAYTRLDATFESTARIVNESNSTAETAQGLLSEFVVEPGDRIPGLPRDTLRLNWSFDVTDRWNVGWTLIAHGFSYSRGNENNASTPGGTDSDGTAVTARNDPSITVNPGRAYTGLGRTGGYAVVNFLASYRSSRRWSWFVRVDNVFDREYATAGELGLNPFTPSRWGYRDATGFNYNSLDWTHSQFIGPGAPRAIWVGATFSLAPPTGASR
ncbi:MAG: TonB-dependent receptor plug domain-containing protein [Betaproteobacteria bacterium]|nr:TonB-dependent receptor plug domain-containing protein [Betaproteobacteria bacterium]